MLNRAETRENKRKSLRLPDQVLKDPLQTLIQAPRTPTHLSDPNTQAPYTSLGPQHPGRLRLSQTPAPRTPCRHSRAQDHALFIPQTEKLSDLCTGTQDKDLFLSVVQGAWTKLPTEDPGCLQVTKLAAKLNCCKDFGLDDILAVEFSNSDSRLSGNIRKQ